MLHGQQWCEKVSTLIAALSEFSTNATNAWRHIQEIGSLEDVCAFCLEPRLFNIHNLHHGIQNGEAENARRCPYTSRGSAFEIHGDPFWSWWICALPDSQQERSDAEDGRAYPQVGDLIKRKEGGERVQRKDPQIPPVQNGSILDEIASILAAYLFGATSRLDFSHCKVNEQNSYLTAGMSNCFEAQVSSKWPTGSSCDLSSTREISFRTMNQNLITIHSPKGKP